MFVNASNMKDMILIKDLPSNIVKEAYIVLKPNIKLKNKIETLNKETKENYPVYIVKEAENVISNYLAGLEESKKLRNLEVEKIKKKYEKLRKLCVGLGIFLFLNLFIQIIK